MILIPEAIRRLRPNTEWTMIGDDIAGVTFSVSDVEPLSQAEVDAEIAMIEAETEAKVQADAAARAAAIAHAKSLGFTDAMIAVMYPNLGSN